MSSVITHARVKHRPAATQQRRVTVRMRHAVNEFFSHQLWLWYKEAKAAGRDNQAKAYWNAHKAIIKVPIALNSGQEAKMVPFIGDKIGKQLQDALVAKRIEVGRDTLTLDDVRTPRKRPSGSATNVRQSNSVDMDLEQIDSAIKVEQPHGDDLIPTSASSSSGFIRNLLPSESEYESKSSLQSVQSHKMSNGIEIKSELGAGNEKKWSAGVQSSTMPIQCQPGHGLQCTSVISNITASALASSANATSQQSPTLPPGSYEIQLLVDKCEGATKTKRDNIFLALKQQSHLSVSELNRRTLAIGDYCWVAVAVDPSTQQPCELVLNTIIERKRTDDLSKSIKDTDRYREQKRRLIQSRIPNRIYLIESFEKRHDNGLNAKTERQSRIHPQTHEGFIVQETINASDTAAYLLAVTQTLKKQFEHKTLRMCNPLHEKVFQCDPDSPNTIMLPEYNCFQESLKKTPPMSVKQLFSRQLLLIQGVTEPMARAICDRYATMSQLIDAYSNNNSHLDHDQRQAQNEKLLNTIRYKQGDDNQKTVGLAVSKKITMFFD